MTANNNGKVWAITWRVLVALLGLVIVSFQIIDFVEEQSIRGRAEISKDIQELKENDRCQDEDIDDLETGIAEIKTELTYIRRDVTEIKKAVK